LLCAFANAVVEAFKGLSMTDDAGNDTAQHAQHAQQAPRDQAQDGARSGSESADDINNFVNALASVQSRCLSYPDF
jgi:hypothetical protein